MKLSDFIALATLPLPFTPLGVRLFTFGGQYVPEIYLALWALIFLLKDRRRLTIAKSLFLSKTWLAAAFFVTGLSLISGLRSDFDIISFYGRLRALLVSVGGLTIVVAAARRGWEEGLTKALIIICSSASVMYLVAGLLSARTDDITKTGISMICFSIACCLLIERRKVPYALLIAAAGLFAAYLSFFRQNYLLAIYLSAISILTSVAGSIHIKPGSFVVRRQAWAIAVLPAISVFLILHHWSELVQFLMSSESRYIQSIGKMQDALELFNNGTMDGSAELRLGSFAYLFSNAFSYFLPNGLIDDSSLTLHSLWGGPIHDEGMSVVRDSVLAFLIVTFGFMLLAMGIAFYFRQYLSSLTIRPNATVVRTLFLAPGLLTVFFLDGATLTQIQKSLFFGIALGLLISPKYAKKS